MNDIINIRKILVLTIIFSMTISGNIIADEVRTDIATTSISNSTEKNNTSINPIKSIKLNKKIKTLMQGKKYVLKAFVDIENKGLDKDEKYIFLSKNNTIASVSSNGVIKGKKEGKTYIICSSESGLVKARCKIIVKKPVNKISSIVIDKTNVRTAKNKKRVLNIKVKYKSNNKLEKEPVKWTSSDNNIVTVNSKGIIKGRHPGNATITVKSKYSKKSAKCKVNVVNKLKFVAVTFDDGPSDYTDKLVNALKKNNSYGTFFVLGRQAKRHPNQIKHELHNGNEIGSHSYSHANLIKLSKKDIKSEIENTNKQINSLTGSNPTLFRPPYGNYNGTVQKYIDVPMIYWSIDTLDWKYKNSNYVYNYLMKHTYAGNIILMHDIHPTTVNGFVKALPKLRKKGVEFVTVSELYTIYNKKLRPKKVHYSPKND